MVLNRQLTLKHVHVTNIFFSYQNIVVKCKMFGNPNWVRYDDTHWPEDN